METNKAPKRIILDHFDELVRQIDVHTEQLLERFSDDDVLDDHWNITEHQVEPFKDISEWQNGIDVWFNEYRKTKSFENVPMRDPKMDLKLIKVKEYLQKKRDEMLAVLVKNQQENLNFYEQNKDKFSGFREKIDQPGGLEELKRQLFSNKFCFLTSTKNNQKETSTFSEAKNLIQLVLVVTDFYLPREHLQPMDDPFLRIDFPKELNQEEIWTNFVLNYISRLLCLSNDDLYILELTRQQIVEKTRKLSIHTENMFKASFETSFLHLTHLDICLNETTDMNENIDSDGVNLQWLPPSLEYLQLHDIKLTKYSLPLLPNLCYLKLVSCDLSELSLDWPSLFPSLRALSMLHCQDVGELNCQQPLDLSPSLKVLECDLQGGPSFSPKSFNALADIDWSFVSDLANLERLQVGRFLKLDFNKFFIRSIHFNGLVKLLKLPNARQLLQLKEIKKLQRLDIIGITLELGDDFPSSFSNLSHLIVSVNTVTRLDPKFLSCTPNLETLVFAADSYPPFTRETFSCLPKLKQLFIKTSIELGSLERGLFSALTSLEILILSDCGDSTLPVGVFDGLEKLQSLNISFSEDSTSLDLDIFLSVPNLHVLKLHLPSTFSLSKPDIEDFLRERTQIYQIIFN